MAGLIYFSGMCLLIILSIIFTRKIKSWIKRGILAILSFYTMYFSILPEHFFSAFIRPIYCDYHKDEKIMVYTTPQEWKNIKGKDIEIKLVVDLFGPNDVAIISPKSYSFDYQEEIVFNNEIYEINSVNKKNPSFVLYKKTKRGHFGEEEYLYYDVKKEVFLVSLKTYFTENVSLLFNTTIKSCEVPNILTIIDYVNDNYLNQ